MHAKAKRAVCLIYGPNLHYLDHLVVISVLMKIPLVVTEPEIFSLARKYYPHLFLLYYNYMEVAEKIVQQFEIVFYATPRVLFDEVFFFAQHLYHKKMHTIWTPHGNSDKGNISLFMEGLDQEKVALIYGKKMMEFMIRKKVFQNLKTHIFINNCRYTYYRENKPFYEEIIAREITLHLNKNPHQIFLFAPTWQDQEGSSSFFDACPHLIEKLPIHSNLIIKLHPNLHIKDAEKVDQLIEKYEKRSNVLFLKEFPPVYPVLDLVDIYIGDMSSIGYDFLTFDKPLFFLNQRRRDKKTDPGLYLYRCGVEILPEDYAKIYQIIDQHLPDDKKQFSQIRKEVYQYTFGQEKSWDRIRQEIQKSYEIFEDDLSLLL